ncbi:hypothetical protein SAMN05421547_12875 [Delftia lacustris]|uniref:Uncharacterized protein n=1 Tax=Delftia lacustris TaxID=558537 RepID=A0A1H3THJ8_9BURK|nr:hypothetical protein SAMN05421547_12875 [Delftia lacustris]
MKQYQPKGSMCQTCCGGSHTCATLPFATMPVIKAYPDGVLAVKCSAHQPAAPAPSMRCLSCGALAPSPLTEGEGLPCGH